MIKFHATATPLDESNSRCGEPAESRGEDAEATAQAALKKVMDRMPVSQWNSIHVVINREEPR